MRQKNGGPHSKGRGRGQDREDLIQSPSLQDDWANMPIPKAMAVPRRASHVQLTSTWAPHSGTGKDGTDKISLHQRSPTSSTESCTKKRVTSCAVAHTWDPATCQVEAAWAVNSELGASPRLARSCLKVPRQQQQN